MNPMRWLAARLRRANQFIGPPLPGYARRDCRGRVYRFRSWWNADFTLHRVSSVMLDGSPLPRLPIDDDQAEDIEVPKNLRRLAK